MRRVDTYLAVGKVSYAESAMADFLRFVKDEKMEPRYLAYGSDKASELRYWQRHFESAETFAALADKSFAVIDRSVLHRERTSVFQRRLNALEGQQRWQDALLELERIDALAGSNPKLQAQVRFHPQRAIIDLHVGKYPEAAKHFAILAADQLKTYGPATTKSHSPKACKAWPFGA